MKLLYVVWKHQQRRAEVLAHRLSANSVYLPNRFVSRYLRPLDYLIKLLATFVAILRDRPQLVIFQAPPPYPALASFAVGVPYAIDAHNVSLQGRWTRVPLARWAVDRAAFVIAHNDEAAALAAGLHPHARVLTLRDPVVELPGTGEADRREPDSVLCICSFGADEPLDVLFALTSARPGLRFYISGDPRQANGVWLDRLREADNVTVTGYLPTDAYRDLLARVGAVVVLTTRPATQPSGACEALSADAPLVLSRTSTTEAMFGEWAQLAQNEGEALAQALDRALAIGPISLATQRERWNAAFERELALVERALEDSVKA